MEYEVKKRRATKHMRGIFEDSNIPAQALHAQAVRQGYTAYYTPYFSRCMLLVKLCTEAVRSYKSHEGGYLGKVCICSRRPSVRSEAGRLKR